MTTSTFFSTVSNETTLELVSVVILRYGTEQVTVEISELEGDTTLEYLVNTYQEELGLDPSRITSYRQDGTLIDKDCVVKAGVVYKLGISAESKARGAFSQGSSASSQGSSASSEGSNEPVFEENFLVAA